MDEKEFRAICLKIAEALPGNWKHILHYDWACKFTREDGVQLLICKKYNVKNLECSIPYIYDEDKNYISIPDDNKISVSPNTRRGMEHIVSNLVKRLIPQAEEYHTKAMDIIKERRKHKRKQIKIKTKCFEAAPSLKFSTSQYDDFEFNDHLMNNDDVGHVKIQISYDGSTKLEARLSNKLTIKILKLIERNISESNKT